MPVLLSGFLLSLLLASSVFAQSKDDAFVTQVTPESQFLDLVDLVADPEKQLNLLDTFLTQFPKYEGISTVYAQMQDLCLNLKQWDRTLTLGDKLLKLDEGDIEAVRLNLKAAEGKNDAALITKWRDRLKQLEPPEGEVTASSAIRLPFVDEEPSGDLANVDLSTIPKAQKPRVEAILFNRALQETDPKRKLEFLSLFERQFPNSSHLGKVRYLFFITHRDRQDHGKALAAAEAFLERDKTREDVLFYVAQNYFAMKRDAEKVLLYSGLTLDIINTKDKPEEVSDADWEKQKTLVTQQANWMIGSTRVTQERWADAEKALRASLASTPHGTEMAAALLSNLGWTNYKLRNIPEALKLYQQCSAIHSAFQAGAVQSIKSIKSEYSLQ
jgi:tetratricopeptide (TPR) repeat protein